MGCGLFRMGSGDRDKVVAVCKDFLLLMLLFSSLSIILLNLTHTHHFMAIQPGENPIGENPIGEFQINLGQHSAAHIPHNLLPRSMIVQIIGTLPNSSYHS